MKNKWPLTLFLMIIVGLTYLFFKLYEPYDEIKDLGWGKKALRNPYLAAEQYLAKNNIKATSSNNFEKVSDLYKKDMVLIGDSRKLLSKKEIKNIFSWLDSGGHLVITAPIYNKNKKDTFLSQFRVKNILNEIEDEKEDDTVKKLSEQLNEMNEDIKNNIKPLKKKKDNKILPSEITYLSFSGVKNKVKIHFSSASSLSHPYLYSDDKYKKTDTDPTYWAGNGDDIYFMQFKVGDGLLSVMTDSHIWHSRKIDNLDHAYLLWILSGVNTEVALFYGASVPSIFNYMWKYMFEFIVAFSIWLLFWLFYRGRRFGSIRGEFLAINRSISEHISASSYFFWRSKKYDSLIIPVRKDIFKRVSRFYPSFDNLNELEKINLISNHCNIEVTQVEIALVKPFDGNENKFISIISNLQKIRNSL